MNAVAKLPAQAYLYVIGAKDGPQKVGIAADPSARRAIFQTANPAEIVVAAAIPVSRLEARAVERYAHWLLRDAHARGEWFSVSPADAAIAIHRAVAAVRAGLTIPKPAKLAGVRGRPRLGVVPTVVRLTKGTRRRIREVVGPNRMAEFIREAVERELQRREAEKTKEPKA